MSYGTVRPGLFIRRPLHTLICCRLCWAFVWTPHSKHRGCRKEGRKEERKPRPHPEASPSPKKQAMSIHKFPTSGEELGYQRAESFASHISIGNSAPDGACMTLAGEQTSLHEVISSSKPTILNFGSCT